MKKKFVYFLVGALLIGLVSVMFQISQASPAIPNPGHGTSQIEGDANLNMNNYKITNLTNPTVASDAATKTYVDAVALPLAALACHEVVNSACCGANPCSCTAQCDTGWVIFCSADPRGSPYVVEVRIEGNGCYMYKSYGGAVSQSSLVATCCLRI